MSASQVDEERKKEKEGEKEQKKKPIVVMVIGMAGSGKTTVMRRLTSSLRENKEGLFVLNLDPACIDLPYPCHIDIRKTVDYKAVMRDYSLGPNGAILTSLNLFASRFDQAVLHIERRAASSSSSSSSDLKS